jgi:enterobactin synthetase component D
VPPDAPGAARATFSRVIRTSPPVLWQPAFVAALPHGMVAGVHIPDSADPVPEDVLDLLPPTERALAVTLGGYRQTQFVGGRLAFNEAFAELGARRAPILPDVHGAPALPRGLVGSVSHKRDLAVALLARGGPGLGVDLEETDRERPGVATRVLRAEELAEIDQLAPDRRWTETALRFSIKEAVYKALHPFLHRYIGFGEVAIRTTPEGIDQVIPYLQADEGPFVFDARHTWVDSRVLTSVRVRPA